MKALVVRRYGVSRRRIAKASVSGEAVMSKPKRNARPALEVTSMFEPSRLAAEHLADAYAQLVPLRLRKAVRCTPEADADPTGDAQVARRRS